MKKVLLSTLFAAIATASVFAQCTPDPQYTVFGVYPPQDTLDIGPTPNGLHSPLPCGVVGQPYEVTFTAVVPTNYTPPGGTSITICSVQLVSMGTLPLTGGNAGPFPAGLSYATLPTNGIFNGGTSGCAKISGTPSVAAMNDLEISTKVKVKLFSCTITGGSTSLTQHFPSRPNETIELKGRYVLTVLANATDVCPSLLFQNLNGETKRSMVVGVAPNPSTGMTYIKVGSQERTEAEFKVTDAYGQIVAVQKVVLTPTENNIIEFDGSKLSTGAYYFSIDNGKDIISDKIIIQH